MLRCEMQKRAHTHGRQVGPAWSAAPIGLEWEFSVARAALAAGNQRDAPLMQSGCDPNRTSSDVRSFDVPVRLFQ